MELHIPPQLMKLRKRRPWWLLLLIPLAVLAALCLLNRPRLTVTVQGEAQMTAQCGTAFQDPGASAQISGRWFFSETVAVTVEGSVDEHTLGTYPLTYSATWTLGPFSVTRQATRQVTVVDTLPPEISLRTDPDYFTLPGDDYVEEGYTAFDACDGDVTDRVVRWKLGDTVYYEVTDSQGNRSRVTRTITYSDPVAPELTLKGKQEMVVLKGKKYKEPGFTAADNFDGDVTDRVTVSGQVDTKTMGEYTLTYSVTDTHGNTATAQRLVTVRDYPELPEDLPLADAYEIVPAEEKTIYLTFDDGPGPYTNYLLNVLKKYDVKATFFVVDRGYHKVLKRMAQEGHTIGLHSATHKYSKIYASETAYFKDLKKVQDTVLEVTGQLSTIVRFPGGTSNTVSCGYNKGIMTRLNKMLQAMNYRVFDWNVLSYDTNGLKDSKTIANRIIGGIMSHKVSVVLQHDIKYHSVMAVEQVIKWGLKNGYTFKALDTTSPKCQTKPDN